MLLVDGFAASCLAQIAQIAQVRNLLATVHDVLEGRVEGMPVYSEQRP
ncbi:hypothetical protein ABT189_33740 [Streptomyces sp900105755]